MDLSIFDENYFEAAIESATDIVFARSEFDYMPKAEGDKAYSGTIRRLLRTEFVSSSNVRISPNSPYITKGDFGFLYGVSNFKALLTKIHGIHRNRYKKASEFLEDVDIIIDRYTRQVERASDFASNYAMMSSAAYLASRHYN